MENRSKKALFYSLLSFVAASMLFWFILGIAPPENLSVPIGADFRFTSFSGAVKAVSRCSFGCFLQIFLIFLSGFSVFPHAVPTAVFAFRGACLGATARAIFSGDLVFRDGASFLGIPAYAAAPALYVISTILIASFAAASAGFSVRTAVPDGHRSRALFGYALFFAAFCGAAVILEFIRYTI